MLLYILIFFMVMALLFFGLRALAHASEKAYKRFVLWGGLLVLMGVMILLMRVGQPYLAAIIGGSGVVLRYAGWIVRMLGVSRILRFFFGTKQHKANTSKHVSQKTMMEEEAREVLGVNKDASEEDIRQQYQKLIKQLHPDKGGNSYLAAKLNEARAVLLKKK